MAIDAILFHFIWDKCVNIASMIKNVTLGILSAASVHLSLPSAG